MVSILDETIKPSSFIEAPSKTEYIINLIKPVISEIIVALIILLIGFIVGKLIGKTAHWVLRTLDINKYWKELTGMNWRIDAAVSGILSGIIYFIVIVMVLNVLGLSTIIAKILGFGIMIIIFISFILAWKDFIPNYIDGLRLYKRLKVKDDVIIEDIKGTVEEVTWTDTKIVTEKGDHLYIPHSTFLKKGFKKLK